MARLFGVTPSYLMGWEENKKIPLTKPELSEGEMLLLDLFRRIPADKQELVLDMIRVALNKQ
jgi:hypothetical protein